MASCQLERTGAIKEVLGEPAVQLRCAFCHANYWLIKEAQVPDTWCPKRPENRRHLQCIHRSQEPLYWVPHRLCGCKDKKMAVFSCRIHGEASETQYEHNQGKMSCHGCFHDGEGYEHAVQPNDTRLEQGGSSNGSLLVTQQSVGPNGAQQPHDAEPDGVFASDDGQPVPEETLISDSGISPVPSGQPDAPYGRTTHGNDAADYGSLAGTPRIKWAGSGWGERDEWPLPAKSDR